MNTAPISQAAAANQAIRTPPRIPVSPAPVMVDASRRIPPGARRMPAIARLQRTEFLDVPVWHAPTGRAHSDWPVVELYARLAWRMDEFEADLQPATRDRGRQGA
ncbi:MAG: hypothetical protein KDC46_09975 [Thermoleophilia bacterium]|nr:hypothetical protein [Thermoleophilia bacterium]